jgi:hypothetical protein
VPCDPQASTRNGWRRPATLYGMHREPRRDRRLPFIKSTPALPDWSCPSGFSDKVIRSGKFPELHGCTPRLRRPCWSVFALNGTLLTCMSAATLPASQCRPHKPLILAGQKWPLAATYPMFWRDKAGRGWYWESEDLGER